MSLMDAAKRERVFVAFFLICATVSLVHAVHTAYFSIALFHAQAGGQSMPTDHVVTFAPNAYRMAMPALRDVLLRLFHTQNWSAVLALLDGIFLLPALYIGYLLTESGLPIQSQQRLAAVGFYLAFVQFPLAWIVPWQRPETTPTALYVMLFLIAVTRLDTDRRWFAVMLAATLVQGFVRSDVPILMGVAFFLLAALGVLAEAGSRSINMLRGACVVAVGAGIQAYLQLMRFPHLPYAPDTPLIQLGRNLLPSNVLAFLVVVLPFLGLAVFLLVWKQALRPADKLTLATSALYLPVLYLVAVLREVRLFVPCMMALCVVAARTFAFALTRDRDVTS